MPPILLSPTFWKLAGAALLALALATAVTVFVHHYHDLEAQAALVPGLQRANASLVDQAKHSDQRAAKAGVDLAKAYVQLDQAEADLAAFHRLAGQIGTTLQGISRNANATKNPVCLPTDSERVLFNAAVARYLNPDAGAGQTGTPGPVPAGAP